MNSIDNTAKNALLAMAEDLEDGSYTATDTLYRHTQPFGLYCQFSEWCLADPQHGVLQHVTKSDQLRAEIQSLVQLCKEQNTDVDSWRALTQPIMQIALGDAGGKEAKATDVAYGIAKAIADGDVRIAGAAIRKLMRLTDKKTLYDKLVELASSATHKAEAAHKTDAAQVHSTYDPTFAEAIRVAANWLVDHLSCTFSHHYSSTWNKGHWEANPCPTKEMKEDLRLSLYLTLCLKINGRIESSINVDRWQMEKIVSQAAYCCSGLSKHRFSLSMDIARMTVGQGRVSVWRKLNPNMPSSNHEFCSPSQYIGLEEHWLPEEPTRDLLKLRPNMLEYSRPPEVYECFADFIECTPLSNLPYPLAQPSTPRPWENNRKRKRRR